MTERRRISWRRLAAAFAGFAVIATTGCVPNGQQPDVDPTGGTTTVPRAFTVGTTDRITVTDPAAVTDPASAVVVYNVFQRLMTAEPGGQGPKPDAAVDCRYDTERSVSCVLGTGLKFSNGHDLTSSDVKFSIERALRLDIPGSSASMLESLRRVETPDPLTVRFVLSRVDNQFMSALATPAAAIVDEELYDPDQVRPAGESIVGSGPLQVSFFNDQQLQLARNPLYQGRFGSAIDGIVLQHYETSADLETAMKEREVDVVWRGLGTAAVTRLTRQAGVAADHRTETGFTNIALTNARVRQLWWNPTSRHRKDSAMRAVVAGALQEDRILDSLVPAGIPGTVASFPVGAGAKVSVTWQQRVQLSLAYDPSSPDAADQANQIRTRLEDTGGLSVRLVKATPAQQTDADLVLVDQKAWLSTALAWLLPYLADPLQTTKVDAATKVLRESDPGQPTVAEATSELQHLAATDLVGLPITQTDEMVFVASGWSFNPQALAPGWQLQFSAFSPA